MIESCPVFLFLFYNLPMKIRVLFICFSLLCASYISAEVKIPGRFVRSKITYADSSVYSRVIGPLVVKYMTFNKGYSVNCSLIVANQLVGLKTITPYDEIYLFNVIIGTYCVKGTMSALFMPTSQYSTLSTDVFFRSDLLTKDTTGFQQYKGLVGGWITNP
jgi:hypothetical protein